MSEADQIENDPTSSDQQVSDHSETVATNSEEVEISTPTNQPTEPLPVQSPKKTSTSTTSTKKAQQLAAARQKKADKSRAIELARISEQTKEMRELNGLIAENIQLRARMSELRDMRSAEPAAPVQQDPPAKRSPPPQEPQEQQVETTNVQKERLPGATPMRMTAAQLMRSMGM